MVDPIMMEQSISSLVFKGSIIEAITEAKRQKKLFVVYISGDNEDSVCMDKSTWSESSVEESVSKYCILLHILEGSTNAAQFSALYPQKSAPCITAIGYNGVQLWQTEGFVSAELLSSTLEKAWLSLHVQETTATFLTAALASRNPEQVPSEAHHTASREQGSSSGSSTAEIVNTSADRKDADQKTKDCESLVEETSTKLGGVVSHATAADNLDGIGVEQSDTTMAESVNQVATSSVDAGVDSKPSLKIANRHVADSVNAPQVVDDIEATRFVDPEKATQNEEAHNSDLAPTKSSDIHLNIRLPGGVSLQEKFQPESTLRMVKDYVDDNQESRIGSYDLAIPYPRKVFNNEDLSKTLSELNLLDRQALIVIPHHQAVGHNRGKSSLPSQSTSTSATGASNGESYFSVVKKVLSYVNPLSYLGGGGTANSATSQQASRSSASDSAANSRSQGNFAGSRRSYLVTSNQSSSGSSSTSSTGRNKKPSSSGFGSNIHTLKHDEDDSNFAGRNAFWNGNSTEYGGDDDKK